MRTPLGLLAALALLVPAAPAAAARPTREPSTTVFVELATEPAATAWQRARDDARRQLRTPDQTRRAAAAAGSSQRAVADRSLDALTAALRRAAPDARPLYRTRTLVSGLALRLPAAEVPRLAALPGVRSVRPVTPKRRANGYSVPLTGAPQVWDGPEGHTGEGVRIGIVDSGIDYTHADRCPAFPDRRPSTA
ncbi:hypothetical protein ABZ391_17040, partial [Kitasatospora cineracea]